VSLPGLACGRPEGALYLFIRTEQHLSAAKFVDCCTKHGVALRSGTEFGEAGESYVRLSFAGDPGELAVGISRIAVAVRGLRGA
jgi:aspartate aminotransferase